MRRIAATIALLAALGAFALLAGGAGGGSKDGADYWIELDNAFGLINGGDLKVAGVRAGKITELKLDNRTHRALVGITITQNGFGSLRTDVQCASRPQSLIGEYFVDCLPGTARQVLAKGSTIPVTHTSSTIAPDLVNNVLRRPYKERLSIILGELGAGVGGNAENLDAAIRRAAPALRETDKVLAILGRQNKTLRDLTENADRVVGDLAANRKDVGRWVLEARDTAVASAERRDDIAAGFRKLPGFLEELRPTMAALGQTASAQTPALRNLDASAKQLETLFKNLGPYANASRPAFQALGKASKTGDAAVKAAAPVVRQLDTFAKGTPELGNNLARVLEHLDDPTKYVEEDPRAAKSTGRPAPTGYTGLESLLTYVYDQALSTNIYDQNEHILKISLIPSSSPCADYADVAYAKIHGDECAAALGPNQPGINFPDPSATDTNARRDKKGGRPKTPAMPANPLVAPAPGPAFPPVKVPAKPEPKKPVIDLPPLLPGLPDPPPIDLPKILGGIGDSRAQQDGKLPLLDYLIGR